MDRVTGSSQAVLAALLAATAFGAQAGEDAKAPRVLVGPQDHPLGRVLVHHHRWKLSPVGVLTEQ